MPALLVTACGGAEPAPNVSAEEVASDLAQVRIEPGLWERSTAIVDLSAQGAPREMVTRMRERRSSNRYCITPEQAARPDANFLAAREGGRCVSRSFAMADGRMSGDMVCTDPGSQAQWTARLQGRYAASDYELEMIMEMPNPFESGQMLITSRTQGRRVGVCQAPGTGKGEQRK